MSKNTFITDLKTRISESERIISEQNEYLSALRHLLAKETANAAALPADPSQDSRAPEVHSDLDFKARPSEIVLALVQRSGETGTRPRDIAETLVKHNLIHKGSNAVYSYLSEFKKKGLVRLKSEGIYVASTKPMAVKAATPQKSGKKRRLSPEGLEAIRKAQKARWAAKKAKS